MDFAFHMNIREESDERLAEIGSIVERGITSFKWFMAIPGWGVSDEFLMRGMWETADRGALNVVHAENRGVLAAMRRRSDDKGQHSIARFTHNYPAPTEAAAIKLALAMTEVVGGRTLIFHNTCREGVAAICAAKSKGVKAYGEVCLAYLTHDDSVYRGDPVAALPFLVTPPIREAFHQDALWEGLARGDLDIISTDHTAMRSVPESQALELAGYFGLKIEVPPATVATRRDAAGNRTRAPVAAGWNRDTAAADLLAWSCLRKNSTFGGGSICAARHQHGYSIYTPKVNCCQAMTPISSFLIHLPNMSSMSTTCTPTLTIPCGKAGDPRAKSRRRLAGAVCS